jgi:hypothetical protein
MPILAMVSVTAAGLAQLQGQHRDAARILGAAARLRGSHDDTDLQIRELSRRGRAALGDGLFAEAYQTGWGLDGKTALTETDPARLRGAALSATDSAAAPELNRPQARRA